MNENKQKKSRKIRKHVTAFALCAVMLGLIISMFKMDGYAAVAGDAIVYVADGAEGYTASDVANGSISGGTISGVSISVYQDALTLLSFVKEGEGTYTYSATGTVTELVSDSNGRIIISGLNQYENGYSFRAAGSGIPSEYYVPEYYAQLTQSDGVFYAVMNLYTRDLKAKAVDTNGNGLNGAEFYAEDGIAYGETYNHETSKYSFVKVSDGVYRQAKEGEEGTKTLITGTVDGESGVVYIKGMKITNPTGDGTMMVACHFDKAPAGYGTKVNISSMWNGVPTSLWGESASVVDMGQGIFDVYTNDTPSSGNPGAMIGYGTWKVNDATSDEFNGDFLDQSRWYIESNYSEVNNGYLELKSYLLDATNVDMDNAVLESRGKMGYGYYEARYRAAYVPAMDTFWMINSHLGNKDNTEIDIAENHTSSKIAPNDGKYDYINSHDWNAIYPLKGGGDFLNNLRGTRNMVIPFKDNGDFSNSFFTFGCLYEPGKLTYYVNGEIIYIDYVDSAWRSLNLNGYDMMVKLENNGMGAYVSNYTEDEWNNSLRDDGSGLNINTMYVDYFRYYERTDFNYVDIPYSYTDDGLTSTLPKVPQTSVGGSWTYVSALSDEFDDNEIDMDFTDHEYDFYESKAGKWEKVTYGENEHGETMRLPVELYDKYSFTRGDIFRGTLTSMVNSANPYGDGYYEIRGKAANCDTVSSLTLLGSNGRVSLELYGDPLKEENASEKNMLRFGGEISTQWLDPINIQNAGDLTGEYHVYGIRVQGTTYTAYMDGQVVGTLTSTNPLGNNIKVQLSSDGAIYSGMENGQYTAGDTPERLMEEDRDCNFYVDYLRYYKEGESPDKPITSASLNKTELTLNSVGATDILSMSYEPADTTESTVVTWTSSNPAVATVSSNGTVTAVSSGSAVISGKIGSITKTCNVTVSTGGSEKPITGITLNKTNITIPSSDGTASLEVSITPADTTDNTDVTWTSSNPSVATVSDGLVMAVAPGNTTITATVGSFSKTCSVTVTSKLESIVFSSQKINMVKGAVSNLSVTYIPADTTDDKTLTYTSSIPSVATVDSAGKVTAVSVGTTVITATCGSKKTMCSVVVSAPAVTSVNLSKANVTMNAGSKLTLTLSMLPAGSTAKAVWTSSDTSIATVSANGVITAAAPGTASIKVTAAGLTRSCTVKVKSRLTSIGMNKTTLSLTSGGSSVLSVVYRPSNTTDTKTVTWTTSDPTVATVDATGKVTAVKAGTVTITAKVGSKKAKCMVTVQ